MDKPAHGFKRLYSLKEAAIYLGRTTYGVRELCWNGDLPFIQTKRNGKIWLDVTDLNTFIDRNKTKRFIVTSKRKSRY